MTEYTLSTKDLITALNAVYRCAGPEGFYNPNLCSVLIETGPMLRTTATNGHLLAQYSAAIKPALPDAHFLVCNDDIPNAIDALNRHLHREKDLRDARGPGYVRANRCTLCPTPDRIGIFHKEILTAALRINPGTFPRVSAKVIPLRIKRVFDGGDIGIQTQYLRLIADCFDAAFPKNSGVFFEPIDSLEPVVWSYRDGDALMVVACMPVRNDGELSRPMDEQ